MDDPDQNDYLITPERASAQAEMMARAYLEFHSDEFEDADYHDIEPEITTVLVENEEFSTMVYKVNVEFPIPGAKHVPVFEILIDADTGSSLRTSSIDSGSYLPSQESTESAEELLTVTLVQQYTNGYTDK